MSVLLYARVSTADQALRDLSIPAQLRALRHVCGEHQWHIAGTYTDIGSGRSSRRPGLLAAVGHAKRDQQVEALVVHRIDRLSRNTFHYLTIKGRLRAHGVRIVSVVEALDPSPVNELIEHIMIAQAEFYSVNLAMEVKKGFEERLRRGSGTTTPNTSFRRCLGPQSASLLRLFDHHGAAALAEAITEGGRSRGRCLVLRC